MYRPFQGARALPVNVKTPYYSFGSSAVPAIDVSAAKGADGAIHVGLINADPNQEKKSTCRSPALCAAPSPGVCPVVVLKG